MISHIRTNIMGTISFIGLFPGMRKGQDFIIYPIREEGATSLLIQSDTRMGSIELESGWVTLSRSHPNGAYGHHLQREGCKVVKLSAEDLFTLKANVMATASAKAGTNGIVYTNNSGAIGVFGRKAA